jgi:TRAP-type C4-dicarboxylate transport system substrate-binding protein
VSKIKKVAIIDKSSLRAKRSNPEPAKTNSHIAIILTLCLLVIGMASCSKSGQQDEPLVLIISTHAEVKSASAQGMQAACDKIAELSDGNIIFEPHYEGSLAPEDGVWTALAEGGADLALISEDEFAARTDLCGLFALPGEDFPGNPRMARRMYDELLDTQPALNDELITGAGVRLLAMQPKCNAGFHATTIAVRSMADIRARNFAALTLTGTEYLTAVGAKPEAEPPQNYAEALRTGQIDGILAGWDTVREEGIEGILQKHVLFGAADEENPGGRGVAAGADGYAINEATWTELTSEQQKWIKEALRYGTDFTATMQQKESIEAYKTCKEQGDEIIYFSAAALQPWILASRSVAARWQEEMTAAGKENAPTLYSTLLALAEKYSAM